MAKEEILIIGLGRFGRGLAETLLSLGHEVLGIDANADVVQAASRKMPHVVEADATDIEAMRQLSADEFRTAVVAIGSGVEASILATYVLVDLKIPRIWAKAITKSHGGILERVGAQKVVFPERDMGVRVAHILSGRSIDYLELDPHFALVETEAPKEVCGVPLKDAHIRQKYGLTVVCVKHGDGPFTYATSDTVLSEGDVLVVAGEPSKAEEFASLD